jgi:hypothetical protein
MDLHQIRAKEPSAKGVLEKCQQVRLFYKRRHHHSLDSCIQEVNDDSRLKEIAQYMKDMSKWEPHYVLELWLSRQAGTRISYGVEGLGYFDWRGGLGSGSGKNALIRTAQDLEATTLYTRGGSLTPELLQNAVLEYLGAVEKKLEEQLTIPRAA